jgi:hypothetical protein
MRGVAPGEAEWPAFHALGYNLTESVQAIVLQKSISAPIRELNLYISDNWKEKLTDLCWN